MLAAFAFVLAACGGEARHAAPERPLVSGLTVQTVRYEPISGEIEASGTVRAATSAEVASRTIAAVVAVPVREGDTVERGQMLVRLDDRDLAARRDAARAVLEEAEAAREEVDRAIAAAEAHADLARKTHDRFILLRDQRSVSPQEFDEVAAKRRAADAALEQAEARRRQVEAARERAQAEVRAAEAMAGYARIVSPFDGVVIRRGAEPGMMATPGQTLIVVEDPSRYRLEVTIDAAAAESVGRGDAALVTLDALSGERLEGTVAEIEGGADPASHTVRAKIDLPRDARLRSGLFGRASFAAGEARALLVPEPALVRRGQIEGVYALDGAGRAWFRAITTGRSLAGRIVVLSGLADGDRIVGDPGGRDLDGARVEAEP